MRLLFLILGLAFTGSVSAQVATPSELPIGPGCKYFSWLPGVGNSDECRCQKTGDPDSAPCKALCEADDGSLYKWCEVPWWGDDYTWFKFEYDEPNNGSRVDWRVMNLQSPNAQAYRLYRCDGCQLHDVKNRTLNEGLQPIRAHDNIGRGHGDQHVARETRDVVVTYFLGLAWIRGGRAVKHEDCAEKKFGAAKMIRCRNTGSGAHTTMKDGFAWLSGNRHDLAKRNTEAEEGWLAEGTPYSADDF